MSWALHDIDHLLGTNRVATYDIPCPVCGPSCRDPKNRKRRTLRIWRRHRFASWHCVRCKITGNAHEIGGKGVDPMLLADIRSKQAVRDEAEARAKLAVAQSLYRRRRKPQGSIVEVYLREVRRCRGPIPPTFGFLPANDVHPPAMIAPFGFADEPKPRHLDLPLHRVAGVHITRLKPDGSDKDGDPARIIVGRSSGRPIVLAPMNDVLGLIVCEGIETGLSLAEATGCGVWAAGAASRMPALADAVPSWVDCVAIAVEPDPAGRLGAHELVERLIERGLACEMRWLRETEASA